MRTEGLSRRLGRLRALPALVVDSAAATVFVVAVALERSAIPSRAARPRSPWPPS